MATPLGYVLFDTAVGACALIWGERGLKGVWLPEAAPETTRARILRRFPDAVEAAPPPEIGAAIEAITALLDGEANDLVGVRLDLTEVAEFERRVYEAARAIPPGAVVTYGELARRMGEPGAAQAVGRALARNPFPLVVPCHRILAAGDRLHGFSAPGGLATKRRLLQIEGARRRDQPDLFDPAAQD